MTERFCTRTWVRPIPAESRILNFLGVAAVGLFLCGRVDEPDKSYALLPVRLASIFPKFVDA